MRREGFTLVQKAATAGAHSGPAKMAEGSERRSPRATRCHAGQVLDSVGMAEETYRNKVAIVTGGASGIGAALSKRLAELGAHVVIADRQGDLAREISARIVATGGHASPREVDVRNLAQVKDMVAEAARLGPVEYLFNNAGIAVGGEMDSYAPEDYDDVFDVNLRGVAYGIQAVYPRMIAQRSGHIVNTASLAGLVGSPASGSYTATKHAVVGLSKGLRMEAKRHGVRVSVVCPGAIETPILTGGRFGRMNLPGLTDAKAREMWSLARPMQPDVFARKVLAAVARNVAIIVVPSWWKALWYLERLSPTASELVWGKLLDRIRADLAELPTDTRGNGVVVDARPPA
jgi:NAD(P)-dependent dehydrogenase (short-subunit alcohol dehydrogenase family)